MKRYEVVQHGTLVEMVAANSPTEAVDAAGFDNPESRYWEVFELDADDNVIGGPWKFYD